MRPFMHFLVLGRRKGLTLFCSEKRYKNKPKNLWKEKKRRILEDQGSDYSVLATSYRKEPSGLKQLKN